MGTEPNPEMVDVIDAGGRTIGIATRAAMRAQRLPHRCVYVLVFNSGGDLLVHLRTPTKDVFPSHWDVTIGGVLAAGESFDAGARRETQEELGISVEPEPLFAHNYADSATIVQAMVYRITHDGPFRLQPEEIVRGEFLPIAEAVGAAHQPTCPDGLSVLAEHQRRQDPDDLDPVRQYARRRSTDELIDRLTVHRHGLTVEQFKTFEAELRERGIDVDEVCRRAQRGGPTEARWFGTSPSPRECSFCDRPARTRAWGWMRLAGLPVCPRVFHQCVLHAIDANAPRFSPGLKRLGKRLALGFIVLVILFVLHFWLWRSNDEHVADRELQALVAELDATDPGWRLEEIEAARAIVPDEENAARVVMAAADLIPVDWPTPPPKDKAPTLDERVNAVAPNVALDLALSREVASEMQTVEAAVDAARRLAEMPRGCHPIVYHPDFISTSLARQHKSLSVAKLLCLDAACLAEKGDAAGALRSCRAAVNSGRSIGDEPLAIAVLIRIRCITDALLSLERTLGQCAPSEPALRQTQELLADEDRERLLPNAVRGERAGFHQLAQNVDVGRVPFGTLFPRDKSTNLDLFLAGPGFLKRNHYWILKWMTEMADVVATLEGEALDDAFADLRARIQGTHEHGRPEEKLALSATPALYRLVAPDRRHHAMLRCSIAALAAERYRLRHQRWPDSLMELVDDDLLDAVPLDPFDGEPLRFLPLEDGILVYSIGPDQADDGGNVNRAAPNERGTDLGVRLWNPARRRKPPANGEP